MQTESELQSYGVAPADDRDEEDPEFEIDPALSSPDFDFSGEDPAVDHPDPKPEMAPAWGEEE